MKFPENPLFVGHLHSLLSFFMQMAVPLFVRIQPKNDRMLSQMKRNKAETTHVFGFASWKLAIFLTGVVWGLESEPQRDLCTATGQMQGLMKSGV